MTGENEHERERESAGEPTPPDHSMPEFDAEPGEADASGPADESPRARRFGAWGAARREEPGPSLWHRASQKIKGLFSRPKQEQESSPEFGEAESHGHESSSDELPYLVAPEEHAGANDQPEREWSADERAPEIPTDPVADAHSIPVVEAPVDEPSHDAMPVDGHDEPKEDLKFLWKGAAEPSEPLDEAAVEASADPTFTEDHVSASGEEHFGEQLTEGPTGDMDAPVEPVIEAPRPKRPSLFKRLFGFGSKAPEVEEIPDTGESAIPVAAELPHEGDVDAEPPVHEEPTYSEFAPPPVHEPELESAVVEPGTHEPAWAATQSIDVGEVHPPDVPESHPIEAASLDEVLPMDTSSVEGVHDESLVESTTDEFAVEPAAEAVEPEAPKKPGFFARLFGRKSTEAPPLVEVEAEPEPEHDAVGQLDAVDQGFEVARSEFAPPEHAPDHSFASVEDALPLDALPAETQPIDVPMLDSSTMDMQPAITEASFAPPATPPAEAEPPSSDEHMFFGGNTFDFDTPAKDDRATKEVTPPVDERKTAEVSAMPAEVAAHADEVERKTDEFEMIDMSTIAEPAVSPLAGKTAEVPKVGFIKKLFGRTKEVTQVEPAVAPPPSANPTFLVQKFRTFYNEVVVYKNQKTEFTAGFATAIVTDYTADLSPEQAAQSLAMRLQQMLELQLAESSWMGGEIQELYPDAQYAMACLADEMLTNLEWPGQSAWGRHRLELTIFKSVGSDLEVFKRMDKLLKNGPRTVGTRDLARVYLLVVASGFKGKYRPFNLPRALAEYRRRLYEFVYGGDALLLYAGERRIFPEAESATVVGRGVKRFSLAQQWAAILVLLLVGYTLISHMTWTRVSADLKDMTSRVEQARTTTAPPPSSSGGGGQP